jgi:hypothetical protein
MNFLLGFFAGVIVCTLLVVLYCAGMMKVVVSDGRKE